MVAYFNAIVKDFSTAFFLVVALVMLLSFVRYFLFNYS